MSEPGYVYTVDRFCDRMVKRREEQASRIIADYERQWGGRIQPYAGVFDEEEDAKVFMIGRAKEAITKAEKELDKARKRLKKIEKKFPLTPSPDRV